MNGARRRWTMRAGVTAFAAALFAAAAAQAEPFDYVRIGDADGFGFTDLARLVRAWPGPETLPADSDGDGRLGENEFLPDLNRDGGVAVFSHDNFDNRSADEIADRGHSCVGCLSIGDRTRGSIWTDLSLSASAPPANWPDADGPPPPNNAVFVFDFTAARDGILEHSQLFFNPDFSPKNSVESDYLLQTNSYRNFREATKIQGVFPFRAVFRPAAGGFARFRRAIARRPVSPSSFPCFATHR